jgi:hypothetical protein
MNKFESVIMPLKWFMAILLATLLAGCGSGSSESPAVSSPKAITAYSLGGTSGTINEAAKTISVAKPSGSNVAALVATFTTTGTGVPTVAGVNQVSGTTPNNFTSSKSYIVTAADGTTATYVVTVNVAAGTSAVCVGAGCVPLGTASNYAILAEALVNNVGGGILTAVTGNIGMSPAAATFVTGFSLTLDPTGCFSTPTPASMVTGKIYAADYNTGSCTTPNDLTVAVGDKLAAYNYAAGPPNTPYGTGAFLDAGAAGSIGGLNLAPGTYTWSANPNVTIPTSVTLTGNATDVWIFQIPGTLTMSNTTSVVLGGTAQAKNIFWQVAGAVTLGTSAHMEGIVMSGSSIALQTGATANGRLFAVTNVTLDAATVVQP